MLYASNCINKQNKRDGNTEKTEYVGDKLCERNEKSCIEEQRQTKINKKARRADTRETHKHKKEETLTENTLCSTAPWRKPG